MGIQALMCTRVNVNAAGLIENEFWYVMIPEGPEENPKWEYIRFMYEVHTKYVLSTIRQDTKYPRRVRGWNAECDSILSLSKICPHFSALLITHFH